MADLLVSVIVPTRNRLRFLQEAVESVRRQTYHNWELIVVDDASDDGTADWLQALADSRIRAFRQPERRERSAGRNRGLAVARGQYVLFLDDDDCLRPEAIRRLVSAIEQRSNAVFAAGARVAFDERGNRARVRHPRIPFARIEPWRDVLLGWAPGQGQTLFRSGSLRKAGGWNERLVAAEDHELLLRVGIRGACVVIPWVVLECRTHGGQWQYSDTVATQREFRREFVNRLAGSRRELGERLLVAWTLRKEAADAYQGRRLVQTARLLKRAVRTTPEVLWSPLVGPGFLALWVKALLGAVVGVRVFTAARSIRVGARRARGCEIIGHARVLDRGARLER